MQQQITTWIRAGISCIQIITAEEERAIATISNIARKDLARGKRPEGYALWTWTITHGLRDEAGTLIQGDREDQIKSKDPVDMLRFLMRGNVTVRSIIILKDFHMFLKVANPMLIRLLKEAITWGRNTNRHLIIVGCQLNMQPELEKEIQSIDLPLPDRKELAEVVDGIAKSAKQELNGEKEAVIDAMIGLTTNEAADAASYSVASCKKISPAIIKKIKTDTIKRNGIVEIVEGAVDIDSIGGLDATKKWLAKRVKAFSKEAREFGLVMPKGLLMVGPSGTGKSAIAKIVATILGVPMLRLDGGNVFAGLVGESEKNMRKAIQTAEAMAPCVFLWDEIEKSLSGGQSSGMCDGGTTSRVISTFLQWMQDKTKPVFVVATANDVSQLPPETLRRGRFDQIFFADLPDREDREQIWSIHIKKVGRKPKDFDLTVLAEKTDGYTGAEIESIVSDGLFNAFHENSELTTALLDAAIHETVPLSSTMREKIGQMRKWADGRALNASGKIKAKS
jgi:ATP-dependent 26S proteasome regulatory subunit